MSRFLNALDRAIGIFCLLLHDPSAHVVAVTGATAEEMEAMMRYATTYAQALRLGREAMEDEMHEAAGEALLEQCGFDL